MYGNVSLVTKTDKTSEKVFRGLLYKKDIYQLFNGCLRKPFDLMLSSVKLVFGKLLEPCLI